MGDHKQVNGSIAFLEREKVSLPPSPLCLYFPNFRIVFLYVACCPPRLAVTFETATLAGWLAGCVVCALSLLNRGDDGRGRSGEPVGPYLGHY